jgi:hypothetical protein
VQLQRSAVLGQPSTGRVVEQGPLFGRRLRSALWTAADSCGRSVEPVDVALELGTGDPTAATDVHRSQLALLDERLDGGPTDAEDVGCLVGGQQQLIGVPTD